MTEHAISATLKAGTDFDSPWVVVYGATPEDVEFKLRNLGGVLDATVQAASELRSLHLVGSKLGGQVVEAQAAPAQPQGWGQPATPAPAPVAEPTWATAQPQQQAAPQFGGPANGSPHPEGVRCQGCGTPVQYKAFTSKAGKNLKMWTCPQQRSKGDGHFSEFVN